MVKAEGVRRACCREMTRLDGAAARRRVEKLILVLACQDLPLPVLNRHSRGLQQFRTSQAHVLHVVVDIDNYDDLIRNKIGDSGSSLELHRPRESLFSQPQQQPLTIRRVRFPISACVAFETRAGQYHSPLGRKTRSI